MSTHKICITAEGNNLESKVDQRFGRCKYFIIVDIDNIEFEAVSNSNINVSSGAGIQAGQLVAEKGAKAILTGNVGPKAFQTLEAAGIDVIVGVRGTVEQAIAKYKKGELNKTQNSNVDSKSGM